MPNLLIVGPTNNGKSMIIEKFRRDHPVISHPDREEIPVLALQMPSNPSVTRFYTAILTAMGAPVRKTYQIAHLEQVVLQLLRCAGVRMLIIDELHNVFGGTGDRRREFLNCCGSSATSCGSRWSVSAPTRRTSRSVPTTSWRTGSHRCRCQGGNPPQLMRALCWPVLPRRFRCTGRRRSPLPR
jgi:hypothetical protein